MTGSFRQALRSWRDTVLGRMAWGWGLSAVAAVAAGFVTSFLLLRDASFQGDQERIQAEAHHIGSLLSGDLQRFVVQARRIARDPSVEATLMDSQGREMHIGPVMRLGTPAVEGSTGEPATPSSISILDYRGRRLASTGVAGLEERGGGPWKEALDSGQPQAEFQAADGILTVAFPIRFPGTGNVEGVVVGLYDLGADVTAHRLEHRYRSELAIVPAAEPEQAVASPSAGAFYRLNLAAPLDRLNLRLRLRDSGQRFAGEVRKLLVWHVAAGLALTTLVLLAAMRTARSVTSPIRALADAAQARAAQPGAGAMELPPAAPAEVRSLAQVLDSAFGTIELGHAQLALLQRAMDSARDGITVVDALAPGMPAIYVNRAVEEMSGFAAAELLGRNMRLLHRGEEQQAALEVVRQALRDGAGCTVVLRNRRRDGSLFMNELSIAPVHDASGTLTHYIGIQNDVTERLRVADSVMASQKMEALGRLTGGLAHDFNNLLGIVIGNLDLLAAQLPDDPRIRERVDNAIAAALRGSEVTRSLLAVARRQPLDPVPADVNAQLRELRPLIRNSVGAAVSIEVDLCEEPALARLDPNGFDNVILNLALNSRDAMPGGGTLTLDTRVVEVGPDAQDVPAELPPGRYVRITVRDTGTGMPADVAARALEPFFTTKAQGKGTGLGLSTAYGFVRQLGGSIALDSALGEGTAVRVYLPAIMDVPSRPIASSASVPCTSDAGTVLVVDDEPHLRALTAEWLQQLGHRVLTAGTAAEAIELMGKRSFDVLVTDVVMPGGMDGLALARWAQANRPAMRVFLATGYSEQLGAEELPWTLIEKPFRKADLARALARPGAQPAPEGETR